MHGKAQHIESAKRNRTVAALLDGHSMDYSDWLVTAYFYVIIHLIEAWLGAQGQHSDDHYDRERRVQRGLGGKWPREYRRLKGITRAYRYECEKPNEAYLAELLKKTIAPFLAHLCQCISPSDSGKQLIGELKPG